MRTRAETTVPAPVGSGAGHQLPTQFAYQVQGGFRGGVRILPHQVDQRVLATDRGTPAQLAGEEIGRRAGTFVLLDQVGQGQYRRNAGLAALTFSTNRVRRARSDSCPTAKRKVATVACAARCHSG